MGWERGNRRHIDGPHEFLTTHHAVVVGPEIAELLAINAEHIAGDPAEHIVAAEVDAPAKQPREAGGCGGLAKASVAIFGLDVEAGGDRG